MTWEYPLLILLFKTTLHSSGQCVCKSNVVGLKCDQVRPGFHLASIAEHTFKGTNISPSSPLASLEGLEGTFVNSSYASMRQTFKVRKFWFSFKLHVILHRLCACISWSQPSQHPVIHHHNHLQISPSPVYQKKGNWAVRQEYVAKLSLPIGFQVFSYFFVCRIVVEYF